MTDQHHDGPEFHEGEHYLAKLGLSEFADTPITKSDGSVVAARDFLDICGEHARPMLRGFDSLDETDPRYDQARNMLRKMVGGYLSSDTD